MNHGNIFKIYICILIIFLSCISILAYRSFVKDRDIVISPLPNFLTLFANAEVSTLDIWAPIFEMFENSSQDAPIISAKSALVYDLTAQKAVFSKNPYDKLPMASLTKIMTAIIAIESYKTDDKLKVRKEDLVGENSMGLSNNEVLTVEELLYGLILLSGNDAAEVLASNYNGGRLEFVKTMNNKAQSLGLSNTNFTNPSGLEGDGQQYTTAYDLLVITKHAMSFAIFRKAAATVDYYIPYTSFHKEFYLYNETNLLTSYPGVKGVKTGFTDEAGLCLVTYLDYEGHEIIGIILGSEHRREEMKELLDYSLKIQGINPPYHN